VSFLDPDFIAALGRKLFDLRLGSEDNPILYAIRFCRTWALERPVIQEVLGDAEKMPQYFPIEFREKLHQLFDRNEEYCRLCEELILRETSRIIRKGDQKSFTRLGTWIRRNEERFIHSSEPNRLPWPECYCAVALQWLIKGKVPTKQDVREAAIHELAIRLLPVGPGEQAINAKIKKLRKAAPKKPERIFNELGLADLLEAPSRPGQAYRH
jgi:hypothetical protein